MYPIYNTNYTEGVLNKKYTQLWELWFKFFGDKIRTAAQDTAPQFWETAQRRQEEKSGYTEV